MGNPYAPKPPGTPPSRPQQPTTPPAPDAPPSAPGQPAWPQQPPVGGPSGPYDPQFGPPSPHWPNAPQLAPTKPERPPVDPDEARRGTRAVIKFGLLMLAALITTTLALPWRMISVVIAVGALVIGVQAFRRIWRAGVRGTLLAALSAGMFMTLVLAVTMLAVIPVWNIEMDRQDCLDRALTVTAKSECETRYSTQIKNFQTSLTD